MSLDIQRADGVASPLQRHCCVAVVAFRDRCTLAVPLDHCTVVDRCNCYPEVVPEAGSLSSSVGVVGALADIVLDQDVEEVH